MQNPANTPALHVEGAAAGHSGSSEPGGGAQVVVPEDRVGNPAALHVEGAVEAHSGSSEPGGGAQVVVPEDGVGNPADAEAHVEGPEIVWLLKQVCTEAMLLLQFLSVSIFP